MLDAASIQGSSDTRKLPFQHIKLFPTQDSVDLSSWKYEFTPELIHRSTTTVRKTGQADNSSLSPLVSKGLEQSGAFVEFVLTCRDSSDIVSHRIIYTYR